LATPILALHLGALGDFVLSWPALGLLAGAGEPHLWGRSEWGRLILPPERVHEREATRFASLFAFQLDEDLTAWLGGFERAVVFAAHPPKELLRNLSAVVPQVWEVKTRPDPGVLCHAGDMQLAQLCDLGLSGPAAPLAPRLPPAIPDSGVVLAPGSGGRDKRLGPELVARLAGRLASEHGGITLLLGPAEDQAYAAKLIAALEGIPHKVVHGLDVPEAAALLAGASLYVGADSGVTHLAAALGAPCLAVFQSTSPMVWAPRGPRVRILGSIEAPLLDLSPPEPVMLD